MRFNLYWWHKYSEKWIESSRRNVISTLIGKFAIRIGLVSFCSKCRIEFDNFISMIFGYPFWFIFDFVISSYKKLASVTKLEDFWNSLDTLTQPCNSCHKACFPVLLKRHPQTYDKNSNWGGCFHAILKWITASCDTSGDNMHLVLLISIYKQLNPALSFT